MLSHMETHDHMACAKCLPERLAAIFPKGIWVRNKKLRMMGMVVGHRDIDDLTSEPIIQYENGWVMPADKKDLVKGHYEKRWIDDEPMKAKKHRHDRQLFAGNGEAYFYCADRECGWKQEYHTGD